MASPAPCGGNLRSVSTPRPLRAEPSPPTLLSPPAAPAHPSSPSITCTASIGSLLPHGDMATLATGSPGTRPRWPWAPRAARPPSASSSSHAFLGRRVQFGTPRDWLLDQTQKLAFLRQLSDLQISSKTQRTLQIPTPFQG